MPHPDDPEYGIGAAVAKWTAAGKTVHYALASRGEAGIAGMPPEKAGPLREREQRHSAAIVGVDDVQFWDFPDGEIRDTPELRAKIAGIITELRPDVVITIYSGAEWAPGAPNQRDHIGFSNAVAAAYDSLADPPRWLFENGPEITHGEVVDSYIDVRRRVAVSALRVSLGAGPETPVEEQARRQVEMTTQARPEFDGHHTVEFILRRRPH